MKRTLPVFLLGILCTLETLQSAAQDQLNYRPVLIHYNADFELTKPEFAVYKRVAYLPNSLRNINPINAPKLNGPVKDYYSNGVLWARGYYNNGAPWGEWRFFYPNGQPDCKGVFEGVWQTGVWEFWWPNGQPLMVVEYNKADMRVLSFWNENGEQTVKDGNGTYTTVTVNGQNIKMKMEGPYANGYQAGTWTYGPVGGEILVEQTFKENGLVLKGISYEKKKKEVYTLGNRFKVKPEPDHLLAMSLWTPAPMAYKQDYPVVADIMGYEVQTVPYEAKSKNVKNYFYRIIQRFESGADTLNYGIPIEGECFKGDVQTYLNRNLRYPEVISNQGIEGMIVVQFSISAEGKIDKPSLVKGLHPLLDAEVIRVIGNMPDWHPATQNGKPLSTLYIKSIKVQRSKMFFQQSSSGNM